VRGGAGHGAKADLECHETGDGFGMSMRSEIVACFALSFALGALAAGSPTNGFRFAEISATSLGLSEDGQPVLVYNHGTMSKAGVPADRNRGSYVHPLHGLDGEVLTDDFPRDHYHHRGLFWAWPHVKVGDTHYDLWMLRGIEQRFEQWLARDATAASAVLAVRNGWYVGAKKVMTEDVRLQVHRADGDGRAMDVELTWTVGARPITLQGAEGKSYGGLTLRFAPGTNTVITTPLGNGTKDLHIARLPWADLSAQFAGRKEFSGAAILVAPDHPDYPPEWLTRHYGVLCLGWPGVQAKTFQPGQALRCRYRVWIHRGAPDRERLQQVYREYEERAGEHRTDGRSLLP
jgi:hypothetical protein